MRQEQSQDAVIKRLVEYSSGLSSPKDMSLIDDAVGLISYLVKISGNRAQTINDMRTDITKKDNEISDLRSYVERVQEKCREIITILGLL